MFNLSLANKTDLVFYGNQGSAIQKNNFWVVKTPENPRSYLGNQLIFNDAEASKNLSGWLQIYKDAFQDQTQVKHITLNLQDSSLNQELQDAASQCGLKCGERLVDRLINYNHYLMRGRGHSAQCLSA